MVRSFIALLHVGPVSTAACDVPRLLRRLRRPDPRRLLRRVQDERLRLPGVTTSPHLAATRRAPVRWPVRLRWAGGAPTGRALRRRTLRIPTSFARGHAAVSGPFFDDAIAAELIIIDQTLSDWRGRSSPPRTVCRCRRAPPTRTAVIGVIEPARAGFGSRRLPLIYARCSARRHSAVRVFRNTLDPAAADRAVRET